MNSDRRRLQSRLGERCVPRIGSLAKGAVVAFLMVTTLDAQPPDRPFFTVGTAAAPRGAAVMGDLIVPPGVDAGMAIPVAVIHGARPGPVAAFVAGSHGTEYSSIIAMQRLITRIDPAQLAGTVIIVPVLNVPSFTSMTPRVNPVDGQTMVAPFPGDPNGTQSQRALARFTNDVIAPADVVIDLHGGDLDEDVGQAFGAWVRGGNAVQDAASLRLVQALGLKNIAVYSRPVDAPNTGRGLTGQALIRGKSVVLVAAGRSGAVGPADLTVLIEGSLNVLAALRMIDRPAPPAIKHVYLDAGTPLVTAERDGVFFATLRHDATVKKGDLLGYTTDLLGRKIADVRSPVDGLVMYVHGVPSMSAGTVLAEVLAIMPAPQTEAGVKR